MVHSDEQLPMDTITSALTPALSAMEQHVVGKRDLLKRVLTSLLAGGHLLLEDVPGVGKTTLAKSIAVVMGMDFRRIQFTPDLMPTDITGTSIFHPGTRQFEFQPGPIFSQMVLADEINRASPRTQSALLEVMEEGQVTVDGHSHVIPYPFMVVATENPLDFEGTFPLPENQLDRFMFRLQMGYPSLEDEVALLAQSREMVAPPQVLNPETLVHLRQKVQSVHVAENIRYYLAKLAAHTRNHPHLVLGMSPRTVLSLQDAAKAWAFLHNRPFVIPDDVSELFYDAVAHRVIGTSNTGENLRHILDEVLHTTTPPPGEHL